jgi:PAS domain S-box-containing protein
MERLTGRSKKDLTNVPVEAAYAKEEQPEVRKKLVEETIEKGHMYGFETYFKRPDGTKLPIVANCSLLRDKEGRPLSIIYSAIDITELKEREEELHKRGREQTNAISAFSKVLDETAKGNLSARIDTKGWNEELETIGMSINSLIESVEYKKKEKA